MTTMDVATPSTFVVKHLKSSSQRASSIRPSIGSVPDRALKILIIGDACVGKTSFVQRYVSGTFSRNYKGTIGVDFALKVIKCNNDMDSVRIQLWDIAGQERFTSMTRVYYKDAHGCIIMFDIGNRNSFLNIVKWKRDLDEKCICADGCSLPCVLVANKCDNDNDERAVSDEEIHQLCVQLHFAAWADVSVKADRMVNESMQYLLNVILRSTLTTSITTSTTVGATNIISISSNEHDRSTTNRCIKC